MAVVTNSWQLVLQAGRRRRGLPLAAIVTSGAKTRVRLLGGRAKDPSSIWIAALAYCGLPPSALSSLMEWQWWLDQLVRSGDAEGRLLKLAKSIREMVVIPSGIEQRKNESADDLCERTLWSAVRSSLQPSLLYHLDLLGSNPSVRIHYDAELHFPSGPSYKADWIIENRQQETTAVVLIKIQRSTRQWDIEQSIYDAGRVRYDLARSGATATEHVLLLRSSRRRWLEWMGPGRETRIVPYSFGLHRWFGMELAQHLSTEPPQGG